MFLLLDIIYTIHLMIVFFYVFFELYLFFSINLLMLNFYLLLLNEVNNSMFNVYGVKVYALQRVYIHPIHS